MNVKIPVKYYFITAGIVLFLVLPESWVFGGKSLCIFKNVSGYQCPLCGMTRATFLALRFHAESAIHYNPLVVFLPLLLLSEIIFDLRFDAGKSIRNSIRIAFSLGLLVLFFIRIIFA
ncbi:MAG TPA: DUF2752 domain-containing protein [Bacteroidales bacterium]|nr:DUF2752 domain-containing protein [Bacteroidales bacterium]